MSVARWEMALCFQPRHTVCGAAPDDLSGWCVCGACVCACVCAHVRMLGGGLRRYTNSPPLVKVGKTPFWVLHLVRTLRLPREGISNSSSGHCPHPISYLPIYPKQACMAPTHPPVYPLSHLSFQPSFTHSSVFLPSSICLPILSNIYLSYLIPSFHSFTYPFISFFSFWASLNQSIYIYPSIHQSIFSSFHSFIHLPIRLLVHSFIQQALDFAPRT